MRVKKGDTVYVMTGKEKGKKGKVLQFNTQKNRVLVQGINFVKRHTRQTRQDQPGGILQKESSLHISNLMFYCPRCSRASRLGTKLLSDGSKVRICKKCQEMV
ncbi:MAG: 50S ribosomal protein L24 [Candidatus Omnitrophica bacterium]|nr:50S ribosomal protein L24 [Candidatus Omnitrophota bacterium]MBU4477504.1 50S ribosomal protein L24 [Candidatus Omnitrophota bacterium]MCG2702902.1 50S ribosomal protein L24 [Candidatus Omnitrophota bacterium]